MIICLLLRYFTLTKSSITSQPHTVSSDPAAMTTTYNEALRLTLLQPGNLTVRTVAIQHKPSLNCNSTKQQWDDDGNDLQ